MVLVGEVDQLLGVEQIDGGEAARSQRAGADLLHWLDHLVLPVPKVEFDAVGSLRRRAAHLFRFGRLRRLRGHGDVQLRPIGGESQPATIDNLPAALETGRVGTDY